jgi:hypothetical protein
LRSQLPKAVHPSKAAISVQTCNLAAGLRGVSVKVIQHSRQFIKTLRYRWHSYNSWFLVWEVLPRENRSVIVMQPEAVTLNAV